jgi:hypothetical protein
MAMKHFNKDLDSYVDRKRSGRDEKKRLGLKMSFGSSKEESVPKLAPKKVHVIKGKPGLFDGLFKKKSSDYLNQLEEQQKQGVKLEYMKGQSQLSEREIQAIMKEQEKVEKTRESTLSRMLKNIKLFRKEEEKIAKMVEEEKEFPREQAKPDQDLIEAVKISAKWLGKLSPEEKKAFKATPEYLKFKNACEKHGLTKK